MKIATWNVNSIRVRRDRVLGWLDSERPDVLCLQELKLPADDFPASAFAELGYHAAVHGQKTWNGVAILSRAEPEDVRRGIDDDASDAQARLVSARVAGVRVLSAYFPNGGEVGSEKWHYKLAWMERLRLHLERHEDPASDLLLCGDMNVAPDDADVADPEAWKDTVLCHPDARAGLERLRDWGLADTFRALHPEGSVYSWWDYRNLGFPRNDGLRIDHVLATQGLLSRCRGAGVDREARKGKQPSDHAPAWAEFAD